MLSIVLPCYNEKDNLPALFERLDQVAASGNQLEIILVNNGSMDGSAEVFEKEISKRDIHIFKVATVEKNIGYGFGILSGLRSATGNILAVTHADRQTDPMDVLKALDIYKKQDDENLLVKGTRVNRKMSEAVFSYGMGLLSSLALGVRLKEINAQPKLFSRKFFYEVHEQAPLDFSLDLYFLYCAKQRGRILEFPVQFSKRLAGEAKGGSGSNWKVRRKLIKRSFSYIFELRRQIKQ